MPVLLSWLVEVLLSSASQLDNIAVCLQIVQRMHSVLPKAYSFLNALTKVLTKKIKDQRNFKPYPGKIYLPLPLLQASMKEESKENSTPRVNHSYHLLKTVVK